MPKQSKKRLIVDPFGCGCTECMIGLYTPLDRLTSKQVRKILNGGEVINNTSWPIRFSIKHEDDFITADAGDVAWSIDRSKLNSKLVIEVPA